MKPVMDQLQPGWSAGNVRTGLGYNTIVARTVQDTADYATSSVVKSDKLSTTNAHEPWVGNKVPPHIAFATSKKVGSRANSTGSEQMIIRQTNDYIVQYELASELVA